MMQNLSQPTLVLVRVGKAQELLITLTMSAFYSSVPVSHNCVTMSQHAQYQDSENEAAKWNSATLTC